MPRNERLARPFQGLDPKSSITNELSQGSGSRLGDPKPKAQLGLSLGLPWLSVEPKISGSAQLGELGVICHEQDTGRNPISQ